MGRSTLTRGTGLNGSRAQSDPVFHAYLAEQEAMRNQ